MKLGEQFIDDDGSKFVVKRTFDPTPTLNAVAQLRSAGADSFGESKHVGRIPGWLIAEWCKQAGVRWDDVHARNEVIRKNLLSGDFSAFRNWQGTF